MAAAFICEECPRVLPCAVCGVAFSFQKSGPGRFPRFCSLACKSARTEAQKARYRAEGRQYRRPGYSAEYYARRPTRAMSCAWCERPFETKQHVAKYCGLICMAAALRDGHDRDRTNRIKWAADRAKKNGVDFERFDPFEIFERDGWRCYICGDPTPKELRGTRHPKAPELDHIVPISAGGPHTRENTACACKACNFEKGNGEPQQPGYLRPNWRSPAA
jgi:5-methylcytosine-specific restriction endonuclease McrA